jgi:hypothetical protein
MCHTDFLAIMVRSETGSGSGTLILDPDPTTMTLGDKKEERKQEKRKRNGKGTLIKRKLNFPHIEENSEWSSCNVKND